MVKKVVTYVNFDGDNTTETVYFNLTKAELTKLQLSLPKNIRKQFIDLQDKVKDQEKFMKLDDDQKLDIFAQFFAMLELYIKASYGERSDDGKRFSKDPRAQADFLTSECYSTLVDEFLLKPESMEQFFRALLPELTEADKKKILEE